MQIFQALALIREDKEQTEEKNKIAIANREATHDLDACIEVETSCAFALVIPPFLWCCRQEILRLCFTTSREWRSAAVNSCSTLWIISQILCTQSLIYGFPRLGQRTSTDKFVAILAVFRICMSSRFFRTVVADLRRPVGA